MYWLKDWTLSSLTEHLNYCDSVQGTRPPFFSCHNYLEGILVSFPSTLFLLPFPLPSHYDLSVTSPSHVIPASPITIGTWTHFSCRWKWLGSYIGVKVLGPLKSPPCLCQPCLEITTWKWMLPARYVHYFQTPAYYFVRTLSQLQSSSYYFSCLFDGCLPSRVQATEGWKESPFWLLLYP